MGTMKHETLGSIAFEDKANGISAFVRFNDVKKKPSDYFAGQIVQNNKVVRIYGSYLGFIEFDGQRYWDQRRILPFK
jgi:hypothetical protein